MAIALEGLAAVTLAGGVGTVLVVAADDERRSQYESALHMARISARTVDAEEAESVIGGAAPDVLVLDSGLQRLVLFRLFSLVRTDATDTPTRVVFVGQSGDTGPDDQYLPGEPSAHEVVERVSELLVRAAPSTDASAPDTPVAAPTRSRPRLDVILIGIGLVLLLLGALLFVIQSGAFSRG